jgi:hypothetical protein
MVYLSGKSGGSTLVALLGKDAQLGLECKCGARELWRRLSCRLNVRRCIHCSAVGKDMKGGRRCTVRGTATGAGCSTSWGT